MHSESNAAAAKNANKFNMKSEYTKTIQVNAVLVDSPDRWMTKGELP